MLCLSTIYVTLNFHFLTPTSFATETLPSDLPVVYVDCMGYPNVTKSVGDTFNVSIMVYNLRNETVPKDPNQPWLGYYCLGNLLGFDIVVKWDPEILSLISHLATVPVDIYPNGVLYKPVQSLIDEYNNTAGTCRVAYYHLASGTPPLPKPFNNPGQNNTMLNLTFQVIGNGGCLIELPLVGLGGLQPYPEILFTKNEGFFETPGAPKANFTIWPEIAVENKTVVFDASSSWDPDGSIQSYIWDFGDGNITEINNPVIEHVYNSTGTYTVTLRVVDDGGAKSAQYSKSITVVEKRELRISGVEISSLLVAWKDTLTIRVIVVNDGDTAENFTVSLYHNASTIIDSATNWNLFNETEILNFAKGERSITFYWSTSSVTPENYYAIYVVLSVLPYENETDNFWRSDF